VSSVPGELDAERQAAREAVEQLRLTPVLAESGAQPHGPGEVSRAYLAQSDVFVGIYWQQYGAGSAGASAAASQLDAWRLDATRLDASQVEEEFRLSAGMPRLLYVKRPAPDMAPELRRMLEAIRAEGGVAYKAFATAAELREVLLTDLTTVVAERFEQASEPAPASLIPAPATALVGRADDVTGLVRLLTDDDRRLVVLTGAGGIGKTRLALAVLERSRADWPDGEAFVDLSPVTDPESVPEVIASALGLVVQGREQPADTLRRRLGRRRMLIVLDNFEQVLSAAPMVADLLERAPGLHVLVTSRVVLRVRGGQEWRVEPLPVRPDDDGGTFDAPPADGAAVLAKIPAVRLFVDRVRDVRPGFELSDENAAAVAELCRRLDGLPLALELAAAQMRLLTPAQLLDRLEERLGQPGMLVDLPDRQQTLTATIEWSYDLLPAPAQRLLARLSAFAGPFTADAADEVGGEADASAEDGLSVLLDHSMISPAARPDGAAGLRLLDPIRAFAADRLDHRDQTLGRLERYLVGVLTSASARHGSQGLAMRRLDSELLNLQVVLAWVARRGRPAGPLLRALSEVWVWLVVRGHMGPSSELWRQVGAAREHGLRSESDLIAWIWLMSIDMLVDGRFAEAGDLLDATLPGLRRRVEPARAALLLMERGLARPYTADSPAGAEMAQALEIVRGVDDPLALGYVLSHYGFFLCVDGDPVRARGLHEETLTIARAMDDDNQRAEAHYDLAIDALAVRDPGPARAHLAAAATHYREIDHHDGLAQCLGGLTAVALERDDPGLAAWLIGATAATRERIGLTPRPLVAEAERRVAEQVRASLPGAQFTAQVEAGRTHTATDALAQALLALDGSEPAAAW
jgi:predicted ATPase